MPKMTSHGPFGHLQPKLWAKRRAGSQTGSLTPDHKKSGIDLFPMLPQGVRHGVGKLSTRATTLVQSSSRSKFEAKSYERPKSRDSNPGQFLLQP